MRIPQYMYAMDPECQNLKNPGNPDLIYEGERTSESQILSLKQPARLPSEGHFLIRRGLLEPGQSPREPLIKRISGSLDMGA